MHAQLKIARRIALPSWSGCQTDSHFIIFNHNHPINSAHALSFRGGLPLGVIIVSNEMTSTLKECLSSFESILPENAFYGYKFPNVIITDDSQSECQALSRTWPNTMHLLCIFHVLQSFWTWLHEGKNDVLMDHRQILLLKVKGLVYAHSEEQLNTRFQELLSDEIAIMYPHFIKHLQSYWPKRHKWAVWLRHHLLIHGNHTNNYSEPSIKILKELVLWSRESLQLD